MWESLGTLAPSTRIPGRHEGSERVNLLNLGAGRIYLNKGFCLPMPASKGDGPDDCGASASNADASSSKVIVPEGTVVIRKLSDMTTRYTKSMEITYSTYWNLAFIL